LALPVFPEVHDTYPLSRSDLSAFFTLVTLRQTFAAITLSDGNIGEGMNFRKNTKTKISCGLSSSSNMQLGVLK
jgi:hypothetical protein